MTTLKHCLALLLACVIIYGCSKSDNDGINQRRIPRYDKISQLKVENYVNRMFIDLVGREPTDSELVANTAFLMADTLKISARTALAVRLQTDTTPLSTEGEGTYNNEYYTWFYENYKARFFKEFSDDEFIAYILDDTKQDSARIETELGREKIHLVLERMRNILRSKELYQNHEMNIREMTAIFINNKMFDTINMKTANFIYGVFDNLFFRRPSPQEFNTSFDIIDYNQTRAFWGKAASNKDEYIDIIVNSNEFLNGMVDYVYLSLMARRANSIEMEYAVSKLAEDNDVARLQRQIIITDEYAQFIPTYD